MPGLLRLKVKEANDLADLIEEKGGNADSLRAAINDVNNPGNDRSSVPVASNIGDEEYLAEKRSQSYIEHGIDLECMICHGKFDQLLSGTCEVCFREWTLSTKPKAGTRKLF